jgi:GT2 family glycosyltransferase
LKISVIVPAYRRPIELRNCLIGLLRQTRQPDQVIVVVRESDAETRSVLGDSLLKALPIVEEVVKGAGQVVACNAGLQVATGQLIAITDDDVVPRVDWLRRIEAHFASDGSVGAVGGRDWLNFDGRVVNDSNSTVGKILWYGGVVGNHHLGVGPARFVDHLKGANLSFRAAAIQGLAFDNRLLGNGAQVHNDLAFTLAVRRSGWKILYDPEVAVDHYVAPRHDQDQRRRYSRETHHHAAHNNTLTLLDHLPARRKAVFLIWALLVGSRAHYGIAQFVRFLPAEGMFAISKWRTSMSGRWAGWRSWRGKARAQSQPVAQTVRHNRIPESRVS